MILWCFIFQDNPFVIKKEGALTEFKGLIPDLLRKIEPIINAKFEISHVGDFRFGTQDKYNNWTGMIGELIKGVCFTCIVLGIESVSQGTMCSAQWLCCKHVNPPR